jgi:hypothetical protein
MGVGCKKWEEKEAQEREAGREDRLKRRTRREDSGREGRLRRQGKKRKDMKTEEQRNRERPGNRREDKKTKRRRNMNTADRVRKGRIRK